MLFEQNGTDESDDPGAAEDAVVVAGLDVGRIQVDVGHREVAEGAGAEHGDSSSMPFKIRLTVDFDMPVSQPSAQTRSSTFRVLVPMM